jgi:hypothetical protein
MRYIRGTANVWANQFIRFSSLQGVNAVKARDNLADKRWTTKPCLSVGPLKPNALHRINSVWNISCRHIYVAGTGLNCKFSASAAHGTDSLETSADTNRKSDTETSDLHLVKHDSCNLGLESAQDSSSLPGLPDYDLELEKLPPAKPMEPSFNLAPYVAQSPVLQNLVRLGVDLTALEKVNTAANYIVQVNFHLFLKVCFALL